MVDEDEWEVFRIVLMVISQMKMPMVVPQQQRTAGTTLNTQIGLFDFC